MLEELEVSVVLCAVHECWVVVVAELAECRKDVFHVGSELSMDW